MKRLFVLVAVPALTALLTASLTVLLTVLPNVPGSASTGLARSGSGTTTSTTADTTSDTRSGSASSGAAGAEGDDKPKWRPAQGAWFNTPRHGRLQWVLHQHIVGAIDHAKPGSFIRIALFSFDRKYVAGRLILAHKRGVHVQVLLNDHQVTPAQRMLHRALGTNRWHKSFAYECSHGCRSHGENLHTKFYLFSHTGGAHRTVMTGSVNLTGNSAINQFNDIYVHNGSRKLTHGFKRLFRQMRKDKPAHPAYWVQHLNDSYTLAATPFPRPRPNHDPIITILNRVRCLGATGPTGNNAHHTIVRVVMHAWNDERGTYLAKKIRQLYAAGCDVQLMYGFAGANVRHTFATKTQRGYIPVHTTGYDTNEDGLIDKYTHQKELLISGHYGKSTHTRLVVTGSSNWNTDGARGDEEIFQIKNRSAAWHDYIDDFVRMWTHEKLSTRVKYIPYPDSDPTTTTTSVRPLTLGEALLDPHGPVQRFTIAQEAKPGGPAWESG